MRTLRGSRGAVAAGAATAAGGAATGWAAVLSRGAAAGPQATTTSATPASTARLGAGIGHVLDPTVASLTCGALIISRPIASFKRTVSTPRNGARHAPACPPPAPWSPSALVRVAAVDVQSERFQGARYAP